MARASADIETGGLNGPDELGDIQTPDELAGRICRFLAAEGIEPAAILEPTCGQGALLLAALDHFPAAAKAIGVEINPQYAQALARAVADRPDADRVVVAADNFFAVNWAALLADLPEPILIIGNPPWVTNAALESIGSSNLPRKANFQGLPGLAALTGKANFDISEYMIIHLLEHAGARRVTLAVLCKSAVARRALVHAWRAGMRVQRAAMYSIDARRHFNATVEACLLVCETGDRAPAPACAAHSDIDAAAYQTSFGYDNGQLIADVGAYQKWRHLESGRASRSPYRWRSGIKHDCAKIMELRRAGDVFVNGFGEVVHLEADYVYPMLKSSDIAGQAARPPARWMLVPQKRIGEETGGIAEQAPRTWRYLNSHQKLLDARKSSLYKGKPRFAVFGVGEYSFAPWKVAISGLYKKLRFAVVGPVEGKPVVFDDTCNFLPCASEGEARLLAQLLDSTASREFYESLIFWDAKRPITVEVLNRLDLMALAAELNLDAELKAHQREERAQAAASAYYQLRLLQ